MPPERFWGWVTLIALAAAILLVSCSSAQAAITSRMPVPADLRVTAAVCADEPGLEGCADGLSAFVRPRLRRDRAVVLHEVGHVVDFALWLHECERTLHPVLCDTSRGASSNALLGWRGEMLRILRRGPAWLDGEEAFAEVWSACAIGRRARHGFVTSPMGWVFRVAVYREACALIRRLSRGAGFVMPVGGTVRVRVEVSR